MNLEPAAMIPAVNNEGHDGGLTRGHGLDRLVRQANAASLRDAAQPAGQVCVASWPQPPVHRNDRENADDTISLPVHCTLVAPDIEGDDDGELAIPSALPMQVQMYVDFPAAAVATDRRTATTPSVGGFTHATIDHTASTDDKGATSTERATGKTSNDTLPETPGPNTDRKSTHVAAPLAYKASTQTVQFNPADDLPGASALQLRPVAAGLGGHTPLTLGTVDADPLRQAAGLGQAQEKNDTAGRQDAVQGSALTASPPVTNASGIADTPIAQPGASHTRYAAAPPAETTGEPQSGSADTAGGAEAVTHDQRSSSKVEMTYRFASWGPGHSVQLNLDRGHPGAHMLAAASSRQVHSVLADALDQTRQGAKDRPAMRLTLDGVDDSGEWADEQEGQRWP